MLCVLSVMPAHIHVDTHKSVPYPPTYTHTHTHAAIDTYICMYTLINRYALHMCSGNQRSVYCLHWPAEPSTMRPFYQISRSFLASQARASPLDTTTTPLSPWRSLPHGARTQLKALQMGKHSRISMRCDGKVQLQTTWAERIFRKMHLKWRWTSAAIALQKDSIARN